MLLHPPLLVNVAILTTVCIFLTRIVLKVISVFYVKFSAQINYGQGKS